MEKKLEEYSYIPISGNLPCVKAQRSSLTYLMFDSTGTGRAAVD